MMRAWIVATLLVAPAAAAAQKSDAPPVVVQGLDTYMKAGGDSALNVWLGWWPPSDTAKVRELRMFFSVVKGNFGEPRGYEVVANTSLGSRMRSTYVAIWFDQKPVYLTFHSYQSPQGEWHVLYLGGNSDVQKLWPADLLSALELKGIANH